MSRNAYTLLGLFFAVCIICVFWTGVYGLVQLLG